MGGIREFMGRNFLHFNAREVVGAAEAWGAHLASGGKMLVSLAGAMSTAQLGRTLAPLIRRRKVHAISCTGANLEEDLFNLLAHDEYEIIEDWRALSADDEEDLYQRGFNRVTDTCIPEEEAFRTIEYRLLDLWKRADAKGERHFPHEYLYELLREETFADRYQIDPKDSWLVAAAEKDLPIFVPGWEDSTLGNVFVSHVMKGHLSGYGIVKGGLESLQSLADWYTRTTLGKPVMELSEVGGRSHDAVPMRAIPASEAERTVGFFQVGGGIAGDFPICVVPMIHQDLRRPCPYWSYFCQISDSTTSYGSYSGAIPSEKITWGKLDVDTPSFVIESDATIVAPLVFARLLGW